MEGLVTNMYRITLKNGAERLVTRNETHDKTAIGLWIWMSWQPGEKFLEFNECVVKASAVDMIDKCIEYPEIEGMEYVL